MDSAARANLYSCARPPCSALGRWSAFCPPGRLPSACFLVVGWQRRRRGGAGAARVPPRARALGPLRASRPPPSRGQTQAAGRLAGRQAGRREGGSFEWGRLQAGGRAASERAHASLVSGGRASELAGRPANKCNERGRSRCALTPATRTAARRRRQCNAASTRTPDTRTCVVRRGARFVGSPAPLEFRRSQLADEQGGASEASRAQGRRPLVGPPAASLRNSSALRLTSVGMVADWRQ